MLSGVYNDVNVSEFQKEVDWKLKSVNAGRSV